MIQDFVMAWDANKDKLRSPNQDEGKFRKG